MTHAYTPVRPDDVIEKNWHNTDVANIQSFSSHRILKLFGANDSDFSASLLTHLRMLIDDFRLTAYTVGHKTSDSGQKFLDGLKNRLNYQAPFQDGFSLPNTLSDVILRMGRNILTSDNAAAAMWVQLDDRFAVDRFRVLDCDKIFFQTDKPTMTRSRRFIPYAYINGKQTPLDVANFLWQPMDPDAEQYTGNNPLRPGIRTSFTKMEFLENLRKVLRQHAFPRPLIQLAEDAVINSAPADVRQDPKKLLSYLDEYLKKIKEQLSSLDPDQAIVFYDTLKEITYLETTQRLDPSPIAKLLDQEAIASYKAPPSTVGRGGSSKTGEGLASAELVIFRRSIKALRRVIETVLSRGFTLALRLSAIGGYAKFRLAEFSLRPPSENAQYDQLSIDNVITSWNAGAIDDEEKNRRIRQVLKLEGNAPPGAKVREAVTSGSGGQTERTPVSREKKETSRETTRQNKKSGSDQT